MNEMFSQGGKGSTGILTNKQAIARKFGVKQNEVVYFAVGVDLGGYKVIYDKTTQRAYSLPVLPAGTTAVSLNEQAILAHSAGTVDLGELAAERNEYVTLPGSFTSGSTVNTRNELLTHNGLQYSWGGELPKVVPASSTPDSTGGIGHYAWISVGDAVVRSDVNFLRNRMIGGNVYPFNMSEVAHVGDSIPAGTSFINTEYGLFEMQPKVNGVISSLSRDHVVVDEIVFLRQYNRHIETYISEWTSSGSDVSSLMNALVLAFKTIYIDIPVSLSNNVISSSDGVRIIGIGGAVISLTGSAFDTTKGAIELTGNYTEVSGIKFNTVSTSVTPLRMGNTSYGASDSSRREGIRSNSCTFDGTGFKGANHGNFVVIGAIYPEITFPRFIGQSRAGGNMEILGVKGGYVSEGYAENGLLINFHATSADGTGFPTTDFKFIDCEGIMNSSVLGTLTAP